MAKEIEHKYLVKNRSYLDYAIKKVEISQAYLSKDPFRTVRIRTIDQHGYLTIKGKTEFDTREEYEYEIPLEDAEKLFKIALPGMIQKTRYILDYKGWRWEVDEFHGSREGLILAELELNQSRRDYPLPSFIGEDVTGNPAYYNSNI